MPQCSGGSVEGFRRSVKEAHRNVEEFRPNVPLISVNRSPGGTPQYRGYAPTHYDYPLLFKRRN